VEGNFFCEKNLWQKFQAARQKVKAKIFSSAKNRFTKEYPDLEILEIHLNPEDVF